MTRLTVSPFLSWGMWVAQCPRCPNAEKRGRCDDDTVGGLEAERFTCEVEWPGNLEDIETLVMCRPVPATRNWRQGETLHDLLRENVLNGLVPNSEFEILGDKITIGALESWQRLEIGA